MRRARPLLTGAFPQAARQFGDCRATGCLAERSVPSAVFGEQRRHLVKAPVV
jgi:hypothetical protein